MGLTLRFRAFAYACTSAEGNPSPSLTSRPSKLRSCQPLIQLPGSELAGCRLCTKPFLEHHNRACKEGECHAVNLLNPNKWHSFLSRRQLEDVVQQKKKGDASVFARRQATCRCQACWRAPGRGEGQVRTVKTEGSAWSKATVLSGQKRAKSYLHGA